MGGGPSGVFMLHRDVLLKRFWFLFSARTTENVLTTDVNGFDINVTSSGGVHLFNNTNSRNEGSPSFPSIVTIVSCSILFVLIIVSIVLIARKYGNQNRITNANHNDRYLYQSPSVTMRSEHVYQRTGMADVFSGISNVTITYEKSSKTYSIKLHCEEAEPLVTDEVFTVNTLCLMTLIGIDIL